MRPYRDWATFDEHVRVLSNHPGALPRDTIKRMLFVETCRGTFDGKLRKLGRYGAHAAFTGADLIAAFRELGEITPTGVTSDAALPVDEIVAEHLGNLKTETLALLGTLQLCTGAVSSWAKHSGPERKLGTPGRPVTAGAIARRALMDLHLPGDWKFAAVVAAVKEYCVKNGIQEIPSDTTIRNVRDELNAQ